VTRHRHDGPREATAFEDVETWVRDHLARCQAPGDHGIEDVAQVDAHPDGRVAACAVLVREKPMVPAHRRIAVVDLTGEQVTFLDLPYVECARPTWSPDGSALAVVGSSKEGAAAVVLQGAPHSLAVSATSELPGFVESAHWSPDGSLLALQVAMRGAEISDVYGSGTMGETGEGTWHPRVLPNVGGGKRLAYTWDPRSGDSRVVSELTVWELAWSGTRGLLAVTSEEPDESAWYAAVVSHVDLDRGDQHPVFTPDDQVSVPRSSPSGRRWSVLSGLQSDRGLPAGELVVGRDDHAPATLDMRHIHVTDQRWLDETTVLVAGLRGLETVVATVDVESGAVSEVWSGEQTCGEHFPEVAGLAGRSPLVVLESHREPPTLGVLEPGGFRSVLAADGPGTAYQAARAGTTTPRTWMSSDGQEVQGLLTVPAGEEPAGGYPVVLQVHGGPTHACRNAWVGRDPHLSSLVARGYAVLRPNPRGSTGRGAAFAEAVRGDMGGLDVDDVVAGVQNLVDLGIADPARLGITGISYGGFMAAWVLTRTDLFAASVARSPCTDWLLQHLTSNIAEFDRRFVRGEPFDPESQYAERSPLRHVDRIRTPMLLTAGLEDLATPPSQAQVLYTALSERGVETQLVLYPEEGHGVREPLAIADQCARMIAWFERHLADQPRLDREVS
jgi:dipeptidyl aminopeptidase/acylaminoacyl peptidase